MSMCFFFFMPRRPPSPTRTYTPSPYPTLFRSPVIGGPALAEDYEWAEQTGVAGDLRFGGEGVGKHALTLGTFFAETTFLSRSAFTDRGRTRLSEGGAGNQEDFSAFAVALAGPAIPTLPDIGRASRRARLGL